MRVQTTTDYNKLFRPRVGILVERQRDGFLKVQWDGGTDVEILPSKYVAPIRYSAVVPEHTSRRGRDKIRSEYRVGTERQRRALALAESGYGVDDIMVKCSGVLRREAELLVLGVAK